MPRSAPLKIDRLASVMMKAEMPVRAISDAVDEAGRDADRERRRRPASSGGSAQTCIRPANEIAREAADRADREIHLADRDDDHLRHRDHDVHRRREQQDLDVERRQERGIEDR